MELQTRRTAVNGTNKPDPKHTKSESESNLLELKGNPKYVSNTFGGRISQCRKHTQLRSQTYHLPCMTNLYIGDSLAGVGWNIWIDSIMRSVFNASKCNAYVKGLEETEKMFPSQREVLSLIRF